jgi:hypothetical protein
MDNEWGVFQTPAASMGKSKKVMEAVQQVKSRKQEEDDGEDDWGDITGF